MEKNLDSKGRWRNKIVAFRVSPEEAEQIDACVRLSGLSKQDYITKRLTDREIVVQGNPRVYKALRNQMAEIYEELKHLEKCSEENEELLSTLRLVGETLYGTTRVAPVPPIVTINSCICWRRCGTVIK